MPSAFAYLPPASHALWFIACYQQFTITMFYTAAYFVTLFVNARNLRGTVAPWFLLKLFILCFDFADSSTRSIILQPYNWADTAKVCESFYFRFLSKVQKLHSYTCTLIKAPPPMRPPYLQSGPPKAVVNCCKVHVTAFVSVVSRYLSHSLFNTN